MSPYELLKKLQSFDAGVRQKGFYDLYKAKPIRFAFKPEDVDKFNEIYKLVLNQGLNPIIRTKSGAIKRNEVKNNYAYDCINSRCGSRLTICLCGFIFVYRIGIDKSTRKTDVTGQEAFIAFNKKLKEHGIDLESYKVDPVMGKIIKADIKMPLIEIYEKDKVLENVHHLDFNSSFPAGLVNTHPEFRPVIEELYANRKTNKVYKAILNLSIGYMQSPYTNYIYSTLSRDAINDNDKRIRLLAAKLMMSGRTIIGFNTDGIWYQGEVYHDKDEGDALGQYKNDHINCTFRAKSDGIYEFIEDGQYYPVVRGISSKDIELAQTLPIEAFNDEADTLTGYLRREYWKWGDIYAQTIINYYFNEQEGYVQHENS